MNEAERTGESRSEQIVEDREELDDRERRIQELEEENRQLKTELKRLNAWPEDVPDRNWRGRALVAERKLEKAYERMRALNEQIAEAKGEEL